MNTGMKTFDGLLIYDLSPSAAELTAIAGPEGLDLSTIDPDALPEGVRWVTDDEWQEACERAEGQVTTHRTADLVSSDPSLIVPVEIRVNGEGQAVCCYADADDVVYPSLQAACAAHLLSLEDVLAEAAEECICEHTDSFCPQHNGTGCECDMTTAEATRASLIAEIEAAGLESPEQVADLVLDALDAHGEQAAREQLVNCIAQDERQAGSRVVTAWDGDRDVYGAADPDGISVWWPTDVAQAEIQAAADPGAAVLAMCRLHPARGTWSN